MTESKTYFTVAVNERDAKFNVWNYSYYNTHKEALDHLNTLTRCSDFNWKVYQVTFITNVLDVTNMEPLTIK